MREGGTKIGEEPSERQAQRQAERQELEGAEKVPNEVTKSS